jgi:hypothetical protein
MQAFKNKLIELGIEPMKGISFEPYSIAQIEQLQLKLDTQLPESYQQFLLTYGESTFAELVGVRGMDFGKMYFHHHSLGWHR